MRTKRKHFKPRSKFVRYMRKTRYNKYAGLMFITMSYLCIEYLRDATVAFVFVPLGISLLFAREKVIEI